jgi:outer membrane protein TolC
MDVAELYVAVLRSQRVVEVLKSKVTSLQAHAQDVNHRFQADMASRNELLAVQVALADAQQQEIRAGNALEMMKAAYNRALGRNLAEAVNLVELQDDGDPPSVDDLTRLAWQHRPEIAEITARATALREQAAATCAKSAPQVSLQGGYLYQSDKYIEPNGVAGIALTAEWNLFDAGRTSHQATALSQRAEAELRLRRDAESRIALEIRQKWLEFQTAKQQIAFAKVAIAQADENLRVVREHYVQRIGNNTEVLDAETLRAQAYLNLYNSSYEALLARLRLRRAAGSI